MVIIEGFLLFFCGFFISYLGIFLVDNKIKNLNKLWLVSLILALLICVIELLLGISKKPAIFLSGLLGIVGNIVGYLFF